MLARLFFLKKTSDSKNGDETHNLSLEGLVVPRVKKMLKGNTKTPYFKRIQELTQRAPNDQNWNNLSNKMSKIVLDYNPKYKINIHESTDIND